MEGAILLRAHLERANFTGIYLEGAYLERASLADEKSIGPRLLDTQWRDVNLAMANWAQVRILDDEDRARQLNKPDNTPKSNEEKLRDYEKAIRANRQLAVALQAQGLNEVAARFAYRAQILQKSLLFFQVTRRGATFKRRLQALGALLFSWFLFLLAGYGYRSGRSVAAYLVFIFGFALAYSAFGHLLFLPDALVFSLTSFHGRGFFPGLGNESSLHNPVVVLAACEAVVGLLIEISFIATFTQRFFGK